MSEKPPAMQAIADSLINLPVEELIKIYDFHQECLGMVMSEIQSRMRGLTKQVNDLQEAAEDNWYEKNTRD